jgi:exosortase family protein XrtF
MPLLNFNNKITRFFTLAAVLYISWFVLYELVIKPYTSIDEKLIGVIINESSFLLRLFGYNTYQKQEDQDMQIMGIDGAHPIWIGSPCNAMTLFAFFTFFIIAFPGNFKNKLWFIPFGIVLIHIANLIRVMALALINFYAPGYLEFNHTYTFTIFVYALIFSLWMWWVNYTLKKDKKHEQKI